MNVSTNLDRSSIAIARFPNNEFLLHTFLLCFIEFLFITRFLLYLLDFYYIFNFVLYLRQFYFYLQLQGMVLSVSLGSFCRYQNSLFDIFKNIEQANEFVTQRSLYIFCKMFSKNINCHSIFQFNLFLGVELTFLSVNKNIQ